MKSKRKPITLSDGSHTYTVELTKEGEHHPEEKYTVRAMTPAAAIVAVFGDHWPIMSADHYAKVTCKNMIRDVYVDDERDWPDDELAGVIVGRESMALGEVQVY